MLAEQGVDWSALQTAYGSAEDIPLLLDRLSEFPACRSYEDEPWYSLWSALCHQGDVYSASFAAVPRIIACLGCDTARASADYFHRPVAIELARLHHGIEVPPDLATSYLSAINELPRLAAQAAAADWDEDKCACALAATALATGKYQLARLLVELEPESYQRVLDSILDT